MRSLPQRAGARAKRNIRHGFVRVATRNTGIGAIARRTTGLPANAHPAYWAEVLNFGDLLSPVLLESFLGVHPVHVKHGFSGKILGAGSILHRATCGDIVWGSGLMNEQPVNGQGVTFAAVRGPRSRSLIREAEVPARYGDPGVLLPNFYVPTELERRYAVGLVPHYVDLDVMTTVDTSMTVVDMRDTDWQATVDKIVACDVIISSSLHGLIAAESYGVPAVWVQPTDRIFGGHFKFHDYYEGTDREADLASWSLGIPKLVDRASQPTGVDSASLLEAAQILKDLLHGVSGGQPV